MMQDINTNRYFRFDKDGHSPKFFVFDSNDNLLLSLQLKQELCNFNQLTNMPQLEVCNKVGGVPNQTSGYIRKQIYIIGLSEFVKLGYYYAAGMEDIYTIDSTSGIMPVQFPLRNSLTSYEYIDQQYRVTIERFRLLNAFQTALSKARSIKLLFTLDNVDPLFWEYLKNKIPNISLFITKDNTEFFQLSVQQNDSILKQSITYEWDILQVSNVAALISILGNYFYYYPKVDICRTVGSTDRDKYNSIPLIDSGLILKYSTKLFMLKVSCGVRTADKKYATEGEIE